MAIKMATELGADPSSQARPLLLLVLIQLLAEIKRETPRSLTIGVCLRLAHVTDAELEGAAIRAVNDNTRALITSLLERGTPIAGSTTDRERIALAMKIASELGANLSSPTRSLLLLVLLQLLAEIEHTPSRSVAIGDCMHLAHITDAELEDSSASAEDEDTRALIASLLERAST